MKLFTILYITSNSSDITLLEFLLKKAKVNFKLITVEKQSDFEIALENPLLDIILSDSNLTCYDARSALVYKNKKRPDLPFILAIDSLEEREIAATFGQGITDYVFYKEYFERIVFIIQRAIKEKEAKRKKNELEQMLKEFGKNTQDVLFKFTLDGKVIYSSPAYEVIWKKTLASLYKNLSWLESIIDEDRQRVLDEFLTLARNDNTIGITKSYETNYRIHCADNTIRYIYAKNTQIKDNLNNLTGIIGIARDITEKTQTEKIANIQFTMSHRYEHGYDLAQTLTETVSLVEQELDWDVVILWLFDKKTDSLNQAYSSVKNQADAVIFQQAWSKISVKRGVNEMGWIWQQSIPLWDTDISENAQFQNRVWLKGMKTRLMLPINFDGSFYGIFELCSRYCYKSTPLLLEAYSNLNYWIATCIHHTELEAKLLAATNIDFLTGLLNRSSFEKELHQNVSLHPHLLGLIIINLDHFNDINNFYGSFIGNLILESVAKKLSLLKSRSCEVGRYGGDEFILFVIEQDIHAILDKVKAIMSYFDTEFFTQEKKIYMKASIGVSLYPKDANNEKTLIQFAGIALGEAKKLGGNNFQLYSPTLVPEFSGKLALLSDIQNALVKNEFVLYFQPKVETKTKKIHSVETLIRWRHPQKGMLFPMEFLSLAEEFGLTVAIGQFVFDAVFKILHDWTAKGIVLPVSINVSPKQFNDVDFIKRLQDKLQQYTIDPALIEIELIENTLIERHAIAVDTLATLNQLGINISIDDFGTGYSSFSYLKRYSIKSLKIDKSFIDGLPSNMHDTAIVKAIILMAHSLGIATIAEGVENKEQYEYLYENHCELIQGNYFYPALSQLELEKILLLSVSK